MEQFSQNRYGRISRARRECWWIVGNNGKEKKMKQLPKETPQKSENEILIINHSYGLPPELIMIGMDDSAKFLGITKSTLYTKICHNEYGLEDLLFKHGKKSMFKILDLLDVRDAMWKPKNRRRYMKRKSIYKNNQ